MKKILVRRGCNPARYVGRRGWIGSKARARNFKSTHEAICFCLEHEVNDAVVVVHFGHPRAADVTLPIPAEMSSAGASAEEWLDANDRVAYS